MKVIIAGSRNFNDWELLKRTVSYLLSKTDMPVEIVSGTASGADKLGEKYAKLRGFKLTQFPADWNKYGKSAGVVRNEEMAKYATHCICFWDGKSKGTKSMIDLATKYKLTLKVVKLKLNSEPSDKVIATQQAMP